MLKKRELEDCHILYDLMTHPDVFPFVRHKAYSYEEYLFSTKQLIEQEERGELISRTILDEWGNPIGTINLFDLNNKEGFLGTWLGKPYHGKGYNNLAKESFFNELFFELQIETVFMRVKKENIRSNKAVLKLPYVSISNENRHDLLEHIPNGKQLYNLYEISKDIYTLYVMREKTFDQMNTQILEA